MNQTQKRLQIINLAISIGDTETVRLQTLKLAPMMSDPRIREIVNGLQAENYAQTQQRIIEYIENPPEEIVRRTPEEEDKALIEEFDLFTVPPSEEESSSAYDDTSYEELLQLDDALFETPQNATADTEPVEKRSPSGERPAVSEENDVDLASEWEKLTKDLPEEIREEGNALFELKSIHDTNESYPPIAYIDQKFETLLSHYPPVVGVDNTTDTFKTIANKIALEGYDEKEIEKLIDTVFSLVEEGELPKATALLLLAAATRSPYARLILARELYKGKLLRPNPQEAFDILFKLAEDDNYPEAMCDLAQFYEYGISTKKDPKLAEKLYRNAMEAGISRAQKHYLRIHKKNRSLFGRLFR